MSFIDQQQDLLRVIEDFNFGELILRDLHRFLSLFDVLLVILIPILGSHTSHSLNQCEDEILALAPLPLMTAGVFAALWLMLKHLPAEGDRWAWVPFAGGVAIFSLGFVGLAYSFYPYVVPEQITIYEAAAPPESLAIILVGTAFVLPVIAGYSIYAYRVFGGKATTLSYD